MKKLRFCHLLRNVIINVITFAENLSTTSGFRFNCIALYHSQTRRHVIMQIKVYYSM